jgi:hypothetical protein
MKYTTERDAIIFDMWDNQNMSFHEISNHKIPISLSIKLIRNIIYAGPARRYGVPNQRSTFPQYKKEIYSDFRLKFLELKNINAAIWFIYENNSYKGCISEKSVRRIINNCLKKKKQPALLPISSQSPLSPLSPEI